MTDQERSLETLRDLFNPGDTLYCIIRSVARSGMSRRMDYYAMVDGRPRWITPHMVRVGVPDQSWASWRKSRDCDGARIDGCGMDMCFESAYRLGHVLFPKGFKVEGRGRNGDTSGHDNDGGYAIKHEVL
mgnify:FL=1|jgi:hypothetical protein|tara:strand:+ start:623 stop:1012 length:390 start_codon:yes stop_codon:yes gene_type:complete